MGKLNSFIVWMKGAGSWLSELVIFSSVIFLTLSPVLVGGNAFYSGDILASSEPAFYFYRDSIQSGGNFLLNPYSFGGFPAVLNTIGGLYYPPNYLAFRYLSVSNAYPWIVFFNLLFAAFFVSRFLKLFGISIAGRLMAGLSYVAGIWWYTGELTIINSAPYFPLLFFLMYKTAFSIDKRWFWITTGGIATGFLLLSSNYNFVQELFLACIFFAIYILRIIYRERQDIFELVKIAGRWLLMVLVGFLIGLVQLIPLAVFIPLSTRAGGLAASSIAYGGFGVHELIRFFLPYFHLPYLTDTGITFYMGALPVLFFLLSFGIKKGPARFFIVLYLFVFLAAFKLPYSPIPWLISKIPVFNLLGGSGRWMFLGSFVSAVLVGLGFEAFWDNQYFRLRERLIKFYVLVAVVVTAFVVFANVSLTLFGQSLLNWFYNYFIDNVYNLRPRMQPHDFYRDLIYRMYEQFYGLFDILSLYVFFPVLFLLISAVLFYCYSRGLVFKEHFVFLAVCCVSLNFVAVFAWYAPMYRRFPDDYFPETAKFLQTHPGLTLSVLPEEARDEFLRTYKGDFYANTAFFYESLSPNSNERFGIYSLGYADKLMNRRMGRAAVSLGRSGVSELSFVEFGADIKLSDRVLMIKSRKWQMDLLGVKYLVSVFPFNEGDGLTKVFDGKIPPYDIPIAIYENKEARPYAYFADSLDFMEPDEIKAFERLEEISDEPRRVLIECESCENPLEINKNGERIVKVIEEKHGRVLIETASPQEEFLTIGQNNIPGWKVYIDGAEAEVYMANSVYIGIFVPEGKHRIELKYTYKAILESLFRN